MYNQVLNLEVKTVFFVLGFFLSGSRELQTPHPFRPDGRAILPVLLLQFVKAAGHEPKVLDFGTIKAPLPDPVGVKGASVKIGKKLTNGFKSLIHYLIS